MGAPSFDSRCLDVTIVIILGEGKVRLYAENKNSESTELADLATVFAEKATGFQTMLQLLVGKMSLKQKEIETAKKKAIGDRIRATSTPLPFCLNLFPS